MSIQTSYSIDFQAAFAGLLADLNDYDSVSALLEGGAAIPFGVGLKRGASDDGYVLPSAAGDIVTGIAIHTHARDTIGFANLQSDAGVKPGQMFTLLRRGSINVKVEETVAAGDQVFVRIAAGTGTQLGAFRKSADNNTAVIVKGARFLSSALGGGIAKLSFNANAAAV